MGVARNGRGRAGQVFGLAVGLALIVPAAVSGEEVIKPAVAIAAGTAPDVVKIDRFEIPQWVYEDALLPLDGRIAQVGIQRSDFFPAAWDEHVVAGKTYGVPWNTDVRAYQYNKNTFAEAGIASPPRTWNELDALARKLDQVEDLIRKNGKSPKEAVDQTAHDAQVALDEAWAKIDG